MRRKKKPTQTMSAVATNTALFDELIALGPGSGAARLAVKTHLIGPFIAYLFSCPNGESWAVRSCDALQSNACRTNRDTNAKCRTKVHDGLRVGHSHLVLVAVFRGRSCRESDSTHRDETVDERRLRPDLAHVWLSMRFEFFIVVENFVSLFHVDSFVLTEFLCCFVLWRARSICLQMSNMRDRHVECHLCCVLSRRRPRRS